MPEARTLAGWTAADVLRRLLELRGERAADEEPRAYERGESAESLLVELDAMGIAARLVHVPKEELRFLEAPSLIQLEEGSWLLLHAAGGRSIRVEGPKGMQRLRAAALPPQVSGIAVQIMQGLPPGRGIWSRLGTLLSGQRKIAAQAAVAGLVLMLLTLLPPQLTRLMVDRALGRGSASMVALLAAAVVLVTLFQVWTGWLRARAILYVKTRLETTLGHGFLAHLLSLPFSFLSRSTSGQHLQSFMALSNTQDVLTERVLGAAFDVLLALLYVAVLFSIMPAATVAVIVAAVTMAVLAVAVARRQAEWQRKETEAQNEQRDFLVELLTGAATVKATGAEERVLGEWLRRLKSELALTSSRQRAGLWSETGLDLIRQVVTVVLLIWGARLVLDGRTTIGSLLAFLQMSSALFGSIVSLAATYATFALLRPQLATVEEALELQSRPHRAARLPSARTAPVALDQVWFRYEPDGPWILRELDLHVKAGEKRWLRGPSGSGKSTILRLIGGLYPPERGTVRVGGREPSAAGELMIYLPQFVHLYGGSILENLEILSGHAKRDRLMEAAEASGLGAIVAALPMGYETRFVPGAPTLSGGQRQLVALTAVMASDRPLFLLDEALANVDWVSRSWIENSHWFDGKTMIYASHDAGFGADSVR